MSEEIWRPVTVVDRKTNDGRAFYEVSNLGNVRIVAYTDGAFRARPSKVLSPSISSSGVYRVSLVDSDGKRKLYSISRLVATEFCPNTYKFRCVRHKDGDQSNNCADNLEWYGRERPGMKEISSEPGVVRKHPVRQYDMSCRCVGEYESLAEAVRVLSVNGDLSASCTRKVGQQYGFVWRYTDDDDLAGCYDLEKRPLLVGGYLNSDGSWRYSIRKSGHIYDGDKQVVPFMDKRNRLCVSLENSIGRKRTFPVKALVESTFKTGVYEVLSRSEVRQYNLAGKFIREYDSPLDASQATGINIGGIRGCCCGTVTQCGNFLWRYVQDDDLWGRPEDELKMLVPGVYRMYSKEGKLLAEYDTLTDAARVVNCSAEAIAHVLNNPHRACRGYVWFHSSQDAYFVVTN